MIKRILLKNKESDRELRPNHIWSVKRTLAWLKASKSESRAELGKRIFCNEEILPDNSNSAINSSFCLCDALSEDQQI